MDHSTAIIATDGRLSVDLAAVAWLDAKKRRSGSEKTARAYSDALARFRGTLQRLGLDLDTPDERAIALAAQAWAGQPWDGIRKRSAISGSTYNQRLAILSSFYDYARRYGLNVANPIALVERARVHDYAAAAPLSAEEVRSRLSAIDRRRVAGKRDYALLAVALYTGRRLSELRNMHARDLQLQGDRLLITYPHTKGGGSMSDLLPATITAAVQDWLACLAEHGLSSGGFLWIALGNRTRGTQLGDQGISDIWLARLGTSKVHASRHTFAHAMARVGASGSDIQARLGHASLATTTRYLAALDRAENTHGPELAGLLGI